MALTDRSSHFEFGENWLSYSKTIDLDRIKQAERSLTQGLGLQVEGKSFLDIGCGSGLFSLAALRLGASSLQAIDIDEKSVAATRSLLSKHAPQRRWQVAEGSVLDLPPAFQTGFDIVYSWGVLHHTGAMWRAIQAAAERVAPGGHLAIALYRKTLLCPFWAIEKRLYTRHARTFAPVANVLFKGAWVTGQLVRGRNPLSQIRAYGRDGRGMSWSHDVHDWLGGYPYESASFDEVVGRVETFGFKLVRSNARRRLELGIFGSGCDEYVLARRPATMTIA
jgi:2-polyprenyl-6-hydroxyphenyl methylase/3-demethylubiquinone-9 3-methyltransferase